MNKSFHHNKIPREGSQFICLSVTLIVSVFWTCKKFFRQVFLKECKYFIKEKKNPKYIFDDVEICPDTDRQNSDV